jgi:hypothetical protein
MDVGTIAVNMLVSVLTGVITGVSVGYFGLRSAINQFKTQRAYDRRLDWFEQTVRTVNRFLYLAWKLKNLHLNFGKPMPTAEAAIPDVFANFEKTAIELDTALDESVLFAERKTVIQLREAAFGLADLLATMQLTGNSAPDISDAAEQAWALAKDFRQLRFSLAQSVRADLNLDGVSLDDLLSEQEKMLAQAQRERNQKR